MESLGETILSFLEHIKDFIFYIKYHWKPLKSLGNRERSFSVSQRSPFSNTIL